MSENNNRVCPCCDDDSKTWMDTQGYSPDFDYWYEDWYCEGCYNHWVHREDCQEQPVDDIEFEINHMVEIHEHIINAGFWENNVSLVGAVDKFISMSWKLKDLED